MADATFCFERKARNGREQLVIAVASVYHRGVVLTTQGEVSAT